MTSGLSASTTVAIPQLPQGADSLFPFTRSGKTGFINRTGRVVIQPHFTNPGYFFQGLASFEEDGKWGFINSSGEKVIPPTYDAVGIFSEGLVPVRSDRKWGYIDQNGIMVIQPRFQAAGIMLHNRARVANWDGFTCDSNRPGVTNDTAPEHFFEFPDQLAYSGCSPNNLKIGFIDATGKIVIPPRFSQVSDFSEGLASFWSDAKGDRVGYVNVGYIDEDGLTVIPPRFEYGAGFSEGRAVARMDGTEVYIDRTGHVLGNFPFQDLGDFSEGLARVCNPDGKWGYIGRNGNYTIPPRFASAEAFANGLALVSNTEDGPRYFIDRSGQPDRRIKLLPSTQVLGNFTGGLCVVEQNGKRFYIDRAGTKVADFE